MRLHMPRKLSYVLVALITAGVTGGVSLADSGGVVNACVNDTNGDARIVGGPADCRQHENAQSWGITGPQGAQGAPGPPGPQGDPGPRGPSNAYEAFRFNSTVLVPNTSAWIEITKIPSLPAGQYVITGKVNVDDVAGSGNVDCQIVVGGFFDLGISSIGTGAGEVTRATISSTFGTIIGSAVPAALSCRAYGGTGSVRAWYGEVVATQVAQLTQYGDN